MDLDLDGDFEREVEDDPDVGLDLLLVFDLLFVFDLCVNFATEPELDWDRYRMLRTSGAILDSNSGSETSFRVLDVPNLLLSPSGASTFSSIISEAGTFWTTCLET